MIQRGDIFLWEGTNFIAWCIKRLTQSRWSHVGYCLGDGKIFDADWDGVKIRSFKPYTDHPKRLKIIRPPVSDEQRNKALDSALRHIDAAGYDYYLIWSLLNQLIRGKRQCGEVRDWSGSFVCSELIASAYFKTNAIRFVPDCFDISLTVPDDIAKLWGKHEVSL